MLDRSQSVIRCVALVFAMLLFAGLWANDEPRTVLAMKTMPLSHPVAVLPVPRAAPHAESVPESPPSVPMPQATEQPIKLSISIGEQTRTISVEADTLTLPNRTIKQHLARLPIGLAAGDYRIVDPLGGVGWLRVRLTGLEASDRIADRLLTTTVDGHDVRYIRVERTATRSATAITR